MNALSAAALALVFTPCLAAPAPQTIPSERPRPAFPRDRARWEPPFNHHELPAPAFASIHLALIPKGPRRGSVLVFDAEADQPEGHWVQRWAIVNVMNETPSFQDFELVLPEDGGDLFCSGHAWTSDGELFVAGGTTRYPHEEDDGAFLGGKLAYLYKPDEGPDGTWVRQPDMKADRWYPTVTLIGNDQMVVTGGFSDTEGHGRNDYEAYTVSTATWQKVGPSRLIPGPSFPAGPLHDYPRMHLLSTGELFMAGMAGYAARVDHAAAPGVWTPTAGTSLEHRSYGTSVLMPNAFELQDCVANIGGLGRVGGRPSETVDTFEACWAAGAGPPEWDWALGPALHEPRMNPNAVLLPDGSVLVIGGRTQLDAPNAFTRFPELFSPGSRAWLMMPAETSVRGYHSTAALLPDGRVLSAGGDNREWDYQVFSPPYLGHGAVRPVITGAPATLPYSEVDPRLQTVHHERLPVGAIEKVVLMAPASVTHHSDFGQRHVWMEVVSTSATATSFVPPPDSNFAPRGYYMLFLLSSAGVPSEAAWVKLE